MEPVNVPVRTVRKVAARAGLTAGYVSRVLNGKRNVKLGTAQRIAFAMGISLDRLYDLIEVRRRRGVPKSVTRKIQEGMRGHSKAKTKGARDTGGDAEVSGSLPGGEEYHPAFE